MGSAALIIAGKIKMKHGEITQYETDGLRMKDGSFVPADIIVLATGKVPEFVSKLERSNCSNYQDLALCESRAERFSGMRLSTERDLFGASMNNTSPRVFGAIQDTQGK